MALTVPDHAYIEEFISEREAVLGGGSVSDSLSDIPTSYDGMVRAVRDRRRMRVKPVMPEAYRTTAQDSRPGQALLADMIGRVAATLTAGERRVEVVPDDEADQDEADRAAKLKRFLTAVVLGDSGRPSRLQQEAGEPYIELGVDQVCGDGRNIWWLAERTEALSPARGYPDLDKYQDEDGEETGGGYKRYKAAEKKFQRVAGFPFTVRRPDPLSYYDRKQDGKVTECVVVEMRQRREVYPKYGLRQSDLYGLMVGDPYPPNDPTMGGGMGGKTARCVTYWCCDPTPDEKGECPVRWAYEVDGRRVDEGEDIGPPWGPLPFFPFYGLHTSLPDAMFKGVSVAFFLLRLCDAIDRLESMKFNVASLLSLPAWKWKHVPGWSGAEKTFRVLPGEGYHMADGEDIEPIIVPPQVVAILDSMKNDLMEFVNLVGLPSALRGVSPGAGSPGYLVAQLVAQAKTALAPCLANAADALTALCQHLLWKIEHKYPEGLSVWSYGGKRGKGAGWMTVAAKDVDGRYGLAVTVEPLLPIDKWQQQEAGLTQVQAGAISMRRHREEYLQLESPEEEAEIIEAERIQTHPLIALPRALDAAVRMGRITPQEAQAIKAVEFKIPYSHPAAQAGAGMILDQYGNPLMPQGGGLPPGGPPQGATPGVPTPPPLPVQASQVALQAAGGPTPSGPRALPNYEGQAVGAA